MLAYAAARTSICDNRELAVLQPHGGGLDRAALVTAAADDFARPGVALFAVKFGVPHTDLLNGYILQCIRRADGTASHAQETGGFFRIDLGCAGLKKNETGAHGDAVEDANLRALAALQAAG